MNLPQCLYKLSYFLFSPICDYERFTHILLKWAHAYKWHPICANCTKICIKYRVELYNYQIKYPWRTNMSFCEIHKSFSSITYSIMQGRLTTLESRFRLTYTMMLNLLRVEKLRIQDMLKRSFSEFASRKDEGKHRELLHSLRKKVKDLKPIGIRYRYSSYISSFLQEYLSWSIKLTACNSEFN